jgi:integrase/recombinase XerC
LGDDVRVVAAKLCSLNQAEGNQLLIQYAGSMQGLSAATCNLRIQGIRSLMSLARILGLSSGWSPEIKTHRVGKYRDTRGPGREKILQLLATEAGKNTCAAARNLALLRLNFDLALRRASMLQIDVKHLELKTRSVWVTTKGNNAPGLKELPDKTFAAIEAWLAKRGSSPGPLFVRIRRGDKIDLAARMTADGYFRVLRELAAPLHQPGDRKIRPHGIRHSAITEAVSASRAAGLGLEAVMAFSDHASVATLSHYLDAEAGMQKRISTLISNMAPDASHWKPSS